MIDHTIRHGKFNPVITGKGQLNIYGLGKPGHGAVLSLDGKYRAYDPLPLHKIIADPQPV